MRRTLLALPAAVLALAAVAAAPSAGQSQASRAAVSGAWGYAGAPADGEAIVRAAVEPVVLRMRPDIQAAARERIGESTWLPTRVRIGGAGGRVDVRLEGRERRRFATRPGQVLQVPLRSGQYAQLVQSVRPDGAVEQRFQALEGVQTNVYRPGADGTMELDVTLASSMFAEDIRFTLAYRRAR